MAVDRTSIYEDPLVAALTVVARADIATLERVVGALGALGLAFHKLVFMTSPDGRQATYTIEVAGLDHDGRDVLVERLAALPGVDDARVLDRPTPAFSRLP